MQGNVGDPESVKELGEAFKARFDRLDFLIKNAASGVLKPALDMSVKHWRWCMEINALALVLLTQEFKSLLQPGGRVLALSSMGSYRAIPDYGFIGASNAAWESLIRTLSVELAPLECLCEYGFGGGCGYGCPSFIFLTVSVC
jgi:enoyl-[acyl-carrier protein] reductase III